MLRETERWGGLVDAQRRSVAFDTDRCCGQLDSGQMSTSIDMVVVVRAIIRATRGAD